MVYSRVGGSLAVVFDTSRLEGCMAPCSRA